MNITNNVSNSSLWGVQGNNTVNNTQNQTPVQHHHHHKKTDSKDSVDISNEGKDEQNNSAKSPLDSLVANGTISQDQENAVKSAFISARQNNVAGTYSNNPTNPISGLVANGTITQTQADSITDAFKSGVQGHHGGHHHHAQQVNDTAGSTPSISQASESNNSTLNPSLEDPDLQTILTQSQESEE